MNKIITFWQCFWALGACFEVAIALVIMPTFGWRWLLILSTIPLLVFAIITPVSNINEQHHRNYAPFL